jgi:hypothetical protein
MCLFLFLYFYYCLFRLKTPPTIVQNSVFRNETVYGRGLGKDPLFLEDIYNLSDAPVEDLVEGCGLFFI